MKQRFILSYVPAAKIAALHDEYRARIEAGESVWDCAGDPCYHEQEREVRTEKEALEHALILVPLDEFGEVHVHQQEQEQFGSYKSWETTAKAVVYAGDTVLNWERP
jgi:hypothetical protein